MLSMVSKSYLITKSGVIPIQATSEITILFFFFFVGSCFQKDVLNLVYLCEALNLP